MPTMHHSVPGAMLGARRGIVSKGNTVPISLELVFSTSAVLIF